MAEQAANMEKLSIRFFFFISLTPLYGDGLNGVVQSLCQSAHPALLVAIASVRRENLFAGPSPIGGRCH
jgi:hypothetical protein